MDLHLDSGLASRFTNRSQIARIVTEAWARANLYCPACPSISLEPTPPGTKVVDFWCSDCREPFQLKSQSQPFRSRVSDAAYGPMIRSIETATAPTFLFLHYDPTEWKIISLFFVPRHFLSPSFVEKRPPLRPGARREGWVGCNLLLSTLPGDARVYAVENGTPRHSDEVRRAWRAFAFLRDQEPDSREWTTEVLACIRGLRKRVFTLGDMYGFEDFLARMHPRNRNIKPKIRQQLQILRDHDFLEFQGRGTYRVLINNQTFRGLKNKSQRGQSNEPRSPH